MDIQLICVVAAIALAVLSAFTRVPLWIAVFLLGIGILLGKG